MRKSYCFICFYITFSSSIQIRLDFFMKLYKFFKNDLQSHEWYGQNIEFEPLEKISLNLKVSINTYWLVFQKSFRAFNKKKMVYYTCLSYLLCLSCRLFKKYMIFYFAWFFTYVRNQISTIDHLKIFPLLIFFNQTCKLDP